MGQYLKLFQTHPQYNTYINGDNVFEPNVCYCDNENEIHYNPIDYSKRYLRTVALESGTIGFKIPAAVTTTNVTSISYSTDNGTTWTTTNNTDTLVEISVNVNTDDVILWKGDAQQLANSSSYSEFYGTARFNVDGNIMSLCYGDNFVDEETLSYDYQFYGLFRASKVVSAKHLSLPATTLAKGCYSNMFEVCTSLTTAPQLPATTLAQGCYAAMFRYCISLLNPPQLPATTLADECYKYMFQNCTSLTTAPKLPATTLVERCYSYMFQGCTSLVNAPVLSATTLAVGCYQNMFYGCTSLTTAPVLPATTLVYGCYSSMFSYCSSLTTAPELPATTLADECYSYIFYGCTSLVTAPSVLPATTLASSCYSSMFEGCTSLTTAPALSATTLAHSCYSYMFQNCTSLVTPPTLFATTLADNCYSYMFYGCTSLVNAPSLPSTALADNCYSGMFKNCTSLTTAPTLPATILANSCYSYMFQNCSSLNYIKALFIATPSDTYTEDWVYGVAESGTFVKNSAAQWNVTSNNGIPSGWTVENVEVAINYEEYYLRTTTLENDLIYLMIPSSIQNYITSISYSTDNGATWTDINRPNYDIHIVSIANQQILWKGIAQKFAIGTDDLSFCRFSTSSSLNVDGNIMSLCYGDNFIGKTTLNYNYQFCNLFCLNHVVDASNLILPATTLTNYCYYGMFSGCYSLSTAPTLPATTLANNCYESMFSSCASLTTAPELPVTTLAQSCYQSMFQGCTSLTTAPQLPATTLVNGCYQSMFEGCTSLVTAPTLPATTLVEECYSGMFYGCTSLNRITCLAIDISATNCTDNWVNGVCPAGRFTRAEENAYWITGVNGIPNGWEKRIYGVPVPFFKTKALTDGVIVFEIPSRVTTTYLTSMSYSTDNDETWTTVNNTSSTVTIEVPVTANQEVLWVGSGQALAYSTGYFSRFHGTASFNVEGNIMSLIKPDFYDNPVYTLNRNYQFYGLFRSSEVVDASNLILPATTLYNYCYAAMFQNCSSLTTAPNLPATTLVAQCYDQMFQNCTSLTAAPVLPATTLMPRCYNQMFYGCRSLNYIKAMFTTKPSNTYTQAWVQNVAANGTFVKNSAATWNVTGTSGIPSGWTVQTASE